MGDLPWKAGEAVAFEGADLPGGGRRGASMGREGHPAVTAYERSPLVRYRSPKILE